MATASECLLTGDDNVVNLLECITSAIESNQVRQSDTATMTFLVFCSSLVFLMQAGFAMICSGCVRKKNVQNTILKSLLDVCGSSIAFYLVGYAFAFGGEGDGKNFIGTSNFLLLDSGNDDTGLVYIHWVFQLGFAG